LPGSPNGNLAGSPSGSLGWRPSGSLAVDPGADPPASAPPPATAPRGKIFLVGLGPGAEDYLSLRARQALAEAEVIIGYGTYIKLIQHLLTDQEVIRKGMTEEIDRCVAAYEYAQAGRRVALISSGDIGVYGMAGPTYEVLLRSGWHPGGDIEVEVIPGITSLSACASLVGAPLTHDFCSISLSDLLTPWPVIAQRLAAAARGDFVIALYNPRSGRRTQHLVEAQRILLRHRQPETPVAIVKSAYREGQEIHLTHLGALAEAQLGMLSTVLIGNASTYVQDGLMVTPRGYAQKYDAITGDPRSGERAGRSLSLGLEGWQAAIQEQLGHIHGGSLAALARDRAVPLGELLQAIGPAGAREAGGLVNRQAEDMTGLIAAQVRVGAEQALLEVIPAWGPVRLEIQSPAGLMAEWRLERLAISQDAEGGERISSWKTGSPCFSRDADGSERGRNGWLTLATPESRLRIDATRIAQAWFLRQGDQRREVHFLDAADEAILTLALVGQEPGFEPQAEAAFFQAWRDLTGPAT
jgi:precorrin-3B C17-methyltransferase